MSNAFWAFGSTLQLGDGQSPETFTSIAELTKITPPAISRDSIEVTNHGSPDKWREFKPGLRDGDEMTFEANWLPLDATQGGNTGVLSTFNDDANHNWKILLPDGVSAITFSGHVTSYETDLPIEEQGSLKVTIKVSGPVGFPQ